MNIVCQVLGESLVMIQGGRKPELWVPLGVWETDESALCVWVTKVFPNLVAGFIVE